MNQSYRNEFLLQWNTHSLVSHWGEFKNYILNKEPLLAAVQETHFLDSDSFNYNFNISNYCLYLNNINVTPRQGGAALYVSNKLLHHQIELTTDLNVVGVKLKIAQRDLTVLSLYLSPSDPLNPTHLTQLLAQISRPFIILGDLNAHHRSWGCTNTTQRGKQILNVMEALDLVCINTPTPTHRTIRNNALTYSTIDLAITDPSTATLLTHHVQHDTFFSDHYPIHLELNAPSEQSNFHFLPRWNFRKAAWEDFRKHIDGKTTTEPPDINTFLDTVLQAAHKYVPKTKPPQGFRNAPFWNIICNHAVAKRRRAWKLADRRGTVENVSKARQVEKETKETIRLEKSKSWETLSNTFNRFTPLSRIWTLIRRFSRGRHCNYKIPHLSINNIQYFLPTEVTEQFARHYANISSSRQYTTQLITSLDATLATLDFDSPNTEQYNDIFTKRELTYAISKCGNTSVGPDNVAYAFFKNLSETSLDTLLKALNELWVTSTFPTSWAASTLIPILKPNKPPSSPSSYRPISLTSCASKLFERMVNQRLRAYLESNNKLTDCQQGFRPGRSTADNITHLIDSVQRGFHEKHYTVAVFVDFQNAFDKVNKTALLIKLHKIGLRGRTMKYIKNFLKDRTFSVRCGNTYSQPHNIDHGVPQGSVLSPTLFLIMINDLFADVDSSFKYSIYADDVAFWFTHGDLTFAHNYIQTILIEVNNWCDKWGLTLSPTKTVSLIFNPFRFHPKVNPLKLNGKEISNVKHFKYLGITIDSKLSFKEHFEDITARSVRRLNIMQCISGKDWGADRCTLLRLYTAILRPILDYNAFLFDDIASNKIDSLQTIQNKALRIVTGACRTTNTYNLHIDCNIPLLDQRRKFQLLRFYGRSAQYPNRKTYKILANRYEDDEPSVVQQNIPTIAHRIERQLCRFDIPKHTIFPAPPISSFFLEQVENIEFLFDEPKKHISAQESQQLFIQYQHEHPIFQFLFTDGSVADGRSGAAFTTDGHEKKNRVNDHHSIFSAELIAIHSAIRYIVKENLHRAVICTDSASALRKIANTNTETNTLVYRIKKLLVNLQKEHNIKLLWIPGHTGIPGNDRADQLAKESLTLEPRNSLSLPIKDFQTLLHKHFIKRRQYDWDGRKHYHLYPIKSKIQHFTTSSQDTRQKERALSRLRLGCTKLTHSYIIDKEPPPTCQHCHPTTRYTIPHFLIYCPKHAQHRRNLLLHFQTHNLTLDIPTLLADNPEVIELVFRFLFDTKLIENI